ncbi:LysR family transcriptional regulator [Acidovorax sp. LjRoot129]|uniref:LysR family transcriptional regulator n=1 Tax=Acidovorax sp. LjRoot129 TaxID=3342260 RepID=UPI003ECCFAC5
MHSIPPLHLIAAFDAVMQWRSFQKAADALSLSASTVSHRVRELEKTLGVPLFTRSTRSVAPTPEGLHLHQQTKAALQALQDTFAGYAHQQRSVVRISALPSFARLRLVPSLAGRCIEATDRMRAGAGRRHGKQLTQGLSCNEEKPPRLNTLPLRLRTIAQQRRATAQQSHRSPMRPRPPLCYAIHSTLRT